MPSLQEIPCAAQAAAPEQHVRRRAPFCYALLFICVQLGALVGCFVIAANPWFLDHDDDPWLKPSLGYSQRAQGVACEVVLYGDSSALTGLDPALIQQRTGMKTCNVSEIRPVHAVVGSFYPLDIYLAHNPRPKFILSSWAAYDFRRVAQPTAVSFYVEGFEYAMLFHRRPFFWNAVLRHPSWAYQFAIWVGNSSISDAVVRLRGEHRARWAANGTPRDQRAGFYQYLVPPETHCSMHVNLVMNREKVRAGIQSFKDRYSTGGTQVIFNVSPTADCIPNAGAVVNLMAGLADNRLQLWPLRLFNNGPVHFTPQGSTLYSNEAADQILAILRQQSAAHPSRPDLRPDDQ
jgi:hypothetical protein